MADDSFKEFVEDQLRALSDVVARPMFGGYGLYRGAIFFGIVHDARLYFKTDAHSRARYRACGMEAFAPNAKQTLTSYYEVPAEVVEDAQALTQWALEAVRSATAAPAAGERRGPKRPRSGDAR